MSAGSGTVVVYTFQNASPDGRLRDEFISDKDKLRPGEVYLRNKAAKLESGVHSGLDAVVQCTR